MDCNISVYSPNSREKWITICFLMTRHRRVSDTHTHRHTDTDTLAHTHRHTEREREREKERKRERENKWEERGRWGDTRNYVEGFEVLSTNGWGLVGCRLRSIRLSMSTRFGVFQVPDRHWNSNGGQFGFAGRVAILTCLFVRFTCSAMPQCDCILSTARNRVVKFDRV